MNKQTRRILAGAAALLVCLVLIFSMGGGRTALSAAGNPMLGETQKGSFTRTKDDIVNILLLGIDYGYEYSTLISYKGELQDCHTDAVVVVAINRTQNTIDLISLPRDTVSYAPGVQGMYKLNGVINCVETVEKGIEAVCQTVSWHLGGVKIHHYIAVDVPALIALGDAIGGVEFDLEMSYTATSGHYKKGLQVLDGQGIMDYVRARKNATVDGTDAGRTNRQRKMLSAIFQKLKAQPSLAFKAAGVLFDDDVNIFTDIGLLDAIGLIPAALSLRMDEMQTHALSGDYRSFGMNFTFTDQENRLRVLNEVYGLEAEEEAYVSYRYAQWMKEQGFNAVKHITVGEQVLEWAKKQRGLNDEQKACREQLKQGVADARAAFHQASLTLDGHDTTDLKNARGTLRKQIDEAIALLSYPEKIVWKIDAQWMEDALINECQFNWN